MHYVLHLLYKSTSKDITQRDFEILHRFNIFLVTPMINAFKKFDSREKI